MTIDFENICRLCMMPTKSMIPLFDDNSSLPNKIMMYIPTLKIFAGDKLPKQVCEECVNQINNFDRFKFKCENSQLTLNKYLHNLQLGNEMVEIYAGDNLPTHVCQECADKINSFDNFKLQCERSDVTLNEYLQRQQSEKATGEKCEDWDSSSDEPMVDVSFPQDQTDQRGNFKNICKDKGKNDNRFFSSLKEESVSQEFSYELTKLEPEIEVSLLQESRYRDESVTKLLSTGRTKKISVKSKDTSVPCNICSKLVVQRRLNEHVRRHVGGRPFKCDECGKTFTERNNLKKHSLVHSGLKVHMCDICGKRFKLLNHLRAHHLTHTGQKLHICDVCGKRFSQIGNFKKHELLHTGERPFRCDMCGKSFSQKNTLQIHLAVHTGQRQHICEICGKGFLVKGHLRTHLVVHSGEKKFSCEICGLSYTQRHSLKKHKTKHLI